MDADGLDALASQVHSLLCGLIGVLDQSVGEVSRAEPVSVVSALCEPFRVGLVPVDGGSE